MDLVPWTSTEYTKQHLFLKRQDTPSNQKVSLFFFLSTSFLTKRKLKLMYLNLIWQTCHLILFFFGGNVSFNLINVIWFYFKSNPPLCMHGNLILPFVLVLKIISCPWYIFNHFLHILFRSWSVHYKENHLVFFFFQILF